MSLNFLPCFMDRGNRVRKAPGGDTNDIFDMEQRQRQANINLYEDKNLKKDLTNDPETLRRYHEDGDIECLKQVNRELLPSRRSLSEGHLGKTIRSPPVAVGKENLGTHFKGDLLPRFTVSEKNAKDREESEDEDNKKLEPSKNENSYPISENELEDTEKREKKKPQRPCIRISQPPGGKSSIIF